MYRVIRCVLEILNSIFSLSLWDIGEQNSKKQQKKQFRPNQGVSPRTGRFYELHFERIKMEFEYIATHPVYKHTRLHTAISKVSIFCEQLTLFPCIYTFRVLLFLSFLSLSLSWLLPLFFISFLSLNLCKVVIDFRRWWNIWLFGIFLSSVHIPAISVYRCEPYRPFVFSISHVFISMSVNNSVPWFVCLFRLGPAEMDLLSLHCIVSTLVARYYSYMDFGFVVLFISYLPFVVVQFFAYTVLNARACVCVVYIYTYIYMCRKLYIQINQYNISSWIITQ